MHNERPPFPPASSSGIAPEDETLAPRGAVTAKSPAVTTVSATEQRGGENQRTVDELPKGARPVGRLRVISGDHKGTVFEVTDSLTLGSSASESGLVFTAPDVSSAHARVWSTALGAFHVEDLRSRSGTYINDMRIQRRALIMGDHIRLGAHVVVEFRF